MISYFKEKRTYKSSLFETSPPKLFKIIQKNTSKMQNSENFVRGLVQNNLY
ncbi:hypothetical protein LEP1GSC108_0342 [Leptospira weilii str. UI 13098]|uniref:Uncharacterized protein n=1 Tax=Leptospira weilii str. UI 13098 TaxID=1088542 RepID=M6Q2D3_9LEPT|nr:hypothetical protein LEP1GSC108_0342 [Leptospira weilii str. UI 13098]